MKYRQVNSKVLNKSLIIFFLNALRVAIKSPAQAFSFLRTVNWLRKAAHIRAQWKKQNINVPPIIIFSITNQCNLHCKGCYAQTFHSATMEELSDEKLWSITREAKQLGVSFFVLAGGEPFMRPVILDITSQFPEIIFLIFTNGLLINEEMIARFKKQKNVVPLVSLEGHQDQTDNRRGDGTFDHTQEILTKMKKENIFFGNSLTLTKHNFSTIINEEYIKKLVDIGCKFFLFIEYTPITQDTEDWVLTEQQRSQMMKIMKSYRSKFPALFIAVPWDEDDVGGCLSAGRGFVHINAVGDLEPCPFAPFSDVNLKNTTLKQAIQSKFLERIRAIPELSKENGDGCILWKERKLVQSLLENTDKVTLEQV